MIKPTLIACILFLYCYTPATDLPKAAQVNVRGPVEVSRGQVERPEVQTFEATGYCNCSICCDSETGVTASGKAASMETISADWNVLPEGTWVVIEGIGRRQVQDRGSAIRGNKIDVWFSDHNSALEFGRRQVQVVVE